MAILDVEKEIVELHIRNNSLENLITKLSNKLGVKMFVEKSTNSELTKEPTIEHTSSLREKKPMASSFIRDKIEVIESKFKDLQNELEGFHDLKAFASKEDMATIESRLQEIENKIETVKQETPQCGLLANISNFATKEDIKKLEDKFDRIIDAMIPRLKT